MTTDYIFQIKIIISVFMTEFISFQEDINNEFILHENLI
jgi:hypothetical protein